MATTKSTFNPNMLGRNQKKQLEKTGSFKSSQGDLRNSEGVTVQAAPHVINNGKVDLSQVVEDVKPLGAPTTDLRDLPVAFSGKATESQLQDIATRNPELAGRVGSSVGTTPVPDQFAEVESEEPEDVLARNAETIAGEIRTIEENMTNREGQRTDQLDELGVFEDMRTLNALKAELRAAEDQEIEIPILGKQKLRGRTATKTEFNQLTSPALEKNLLRSLTASRNVSRMTDTINTNIAIVDQKIKADTDRDEFLYKQKQDRLTQVQTAYGNIITEKQKIALEEKKFENELILEDIKSNNTLRADLIKEIAKKGVGGLQLQGLMDASIDELVSFQYETTSPKNWSTMTFEEAAMVLDKDSFGKFEAYKEWEKTASEEDKAAGDQLLAVTQTADITVKLIEDLLNDEEGMSNSVGTGIGNRDFNFFGAGVETTKFRANAKKLMSQATLDKLLELKAAGGTLGAISEKELDILANAATALGAIFDKNGKATGRFEFKEDDFETALETMRGASMKTYIAANIGKEAYAKAGYQFLDVTNEEDFKIVEDRYNDIKENGTTTRVNYADEELKNPVNLNAAFNTIKQEEGLRTEAYQDVTGKWTIGFGNTIIGGRPVQSGDRLTVAQAETLMQQSVIKNYTSFADKVQKQITPNQFAALTSFEYNLGPNVWNTSTGSQILSLVNSGDYSRAGQLMLQYNKARDPQTGDLITNRVLAQRRAREANLLLA
jgi:lysozyme